MVYRIKSSLSRLFNIEKQKVQELSVLLSSLNQEIEKKQNELKELIDKEQRQRNLLESKADIADLCIPFFDSCKKQKQNLVENIAALEQRADELIEEISFHFSQSKRYEVLIKKRKGKEDHDQKIKEQNEVDDLTQNRYIHKLLSL
ncbi:MAG: hypothetical protein ACTSXG_00075 [Alphaproteobacteria bacterium]